MNKRELTNKAKEMVRIRKGALEFHVDNMISKLTKLWLNWWSNEVCAESIYNDDFVMSNDSRLSMEQMCRIDFVLLIKIVSYIENSNSISLNTKREIMPYHDNM